MVIKLSPAKLEFVLNKAIAHFEAGSSIKIDTPIYSDTEYKFSGEETIDMPLKPNETGYVAGTSKTKRKQFHFSYCISIKDNKLTRIRVNSDGDITYVFDGTESKKLTSDFIKRFFLKIYEIENAEFKKVYASYDDTEERNEKLSELLGSTEGEEKKEIINNKEVAKKKWWQ
jgi:hypothetical protein